MFFNSPPSHTPLVCARFSNEVEVTSRKLAPAAGTLGTARGCAAAAYLVRNVSSPEIKPWAVKQPLLFLPRPALPGPLATRRQAAPRSPFTQKSVGVRLFGPFPWTPRICVRTQPLLRSRHLSEFNP